MDALTVLMLRHAEKPVQDTGVGIDTLGQPDASCLAVRGWQRSGALVPLLSGSVRSDLPSPKAVFASAAHPKSRRSEQTVAALTAKLGLVTNTRYGKGDELALAECILTHSGTLVVCWQHEHLPTIARHLLGGASTMTDVPAVWPENRFDVIWKLVRSNGHWSFTQQPQLLLAGDSDRVIE